MDTAESDFNRGYNKNVNILDNKPCKNLLKIYDFVLISVLAIKLQHWANIDNPQNPIKKLDRDALKTSEADNTDDILSHPIVISNKPLINALQSSFVTPNIDKGIHSIEEIKDIILNNEKISKTTENTITNPPIDSNVLIPLNKAIPNKTKKPLSS